MTLLATAPLGPSVGVTSAPGRLTRSADVVRVLRDGRRRSGELLAVHVLTRHPAPAQQPSPGTAARLTVVASRRVGGAVRRNRAKRLLREAARTLPWRSGLDVVLVARADCATSGLHAVTDELARLASRSDALLDAGTDAGADAAGARA